MIDGVRLTEAAAELPAVSYAFRPNRSEVPGLAVVAQDVVVGAKVADDGEVAVILARAALSAAFQVTVTGTAVELTVPVCVLTWGVVEKVGAVVSPTRVAEPDSVVAP